MKLSRQHEELLSLHRDMQYHCSTEYEYMRDHRKRISELNLGYLKEKGYQLVAKKCDGRCGKNHNAMVAMRKAERIFNLPKASVKNERDLNEKARLEHISWFDSLPV